MGCTLGCGLFIFPAQQGKYHPPKADFIARRFHPRKWISSAEGRFH
jgi:hypothetical protein